MKIIGYIFAALLLVLGLMFAVAAVSSGIWQRWILAAVLVGAGLAVIYFLRMKVPEQQVSVTQKIDLTGDVRLEEMTCRNCGAALDSKSVALQEGAIFVTCPFCESSYQIEEAPKW